MVSPFTIFQRNVKGKKIYYCRFRDPITGKRLSGKSVVELRKLYDNKTTTPVRTKYQAMMIAQEVLNRNLLFQEVEENAGETNLIGYVRNFWDYDNSEYIQTKLNFDKNAIGRKYVNNLLATFEKHCRPYLDKKLTLESLKPLHIEKIRSTLIKKKIGASTINYAMQSLRTPLLEAYRLGIIENNIADRIMNVTERPKKVKGIPTAMEVTKLLNHLNCNKEKETYNRIDYLVVALAVTTGMRMGEIRALHKNDIEFLNNQVAIIKIKSAMGTSYEGEKCTKGKRERSATCTTQLAKELLNFSEGNPFPNEYIFWSLVNKNSPVGDRFIRDRFKANLEEIGISQKEQTERNITFHSLRHFFASVLSHSIGAEETRKLMGHQSIEMTNHYTHETIEHLIDIETKKNKVLNLKQLKNA